jgi:hypothetical protein
VVGDQIGVHIKELHNLYASPNIISMMQIKKDEMSGTYITHGKDEKCIQNFGQKT